MATNHQTTVPPTAHSASSDNSLSDNADVEKQPQTQHVEAVRTISRVPNPNYYEKDGLRTYGDDEDHEHEPPVCSQTRN
jgi:hypothetical protein